VRLNTWAGAGWVRLHWVVGQAAARPLVLFHGRFPMVVLGQRKVVEPALALRWMGEGAGGCMGGAFLASWLAGWMVTAY
jgi:hypothetical protein